MSWAYPESKGNAVVCCKGEECECFTTRGTRNQTSYLAREHQGHTFPCRAPGDGTIMHHCPDLPPPLGVFLNDLVVAAVKDLRG